MTWLFQPIPASAALGPGPSETGTTLNPADKDTGIVLSNGNFTMNGPAGNWGVVRATSTRSGKRYFEATLDLVGLGVCVGFANPSAPLSGAWVGSSTNGVGYFHSGYVTYNWATQDGPYAVASSGSVIGCAIDTASGKAWWSVDGVWQNGDPAAGTGGFTASGLGNIVHAALSAVDTGAKASANFGASAWAYGPPGGFTGWDTGAPETVYKGVAWPTFYRGTRTDSQLYKGTGILH
ncbi:MAG: hypothetical protein AB7F98_02530 [Novosphingobium sp.]